MFSDTDKDGDSPIRVPTVDDVASESRITDKSIPLPAVNGETEAKKTNTDENSKNKDSVRKSRLVTYIYYN